MNKREYGLIGFPLSHSFSQKYFTEKFEKEGIEDAIFHAFSMASIDELPSLLEEHRLLKGLAVTIPYKRTVIKYLDTASPEVSSMHACNCIKIANGKLHGYNTDITGFEKSFTRLLQPWHRKALVLGTGGAAAAVIYILQKRGIPFLTVSRKKDPERNVLCYGDLNETIIADHQIIINATPLGTYPDVTSYPPIPYQGVTRQHYFFDLVYNPPKTSFLSFAEKRGATIQNGYEMLVLQAEENWRIWNS